MLFPDFPGERQQTWMRIAMGFQRRPMRRYEYVAHPNLIAPLVVRYPGAAIGCTIHGLGEKPISLRFSDVEPMSSKDVTGDQGRHSAAQDQDGSGTVCSLRLQAPFPGFQSFNVGRDHRSRGRKTNCPGNLVSNRLTASLKSRGNGNQDQDLLASSGQLGQFKWDAACLRWLNTESGSCNKQEEGDWPLAVCTSSGASRGPRLFGHVPNTCLIAKFGKVRNA
jgi:hypothetical protein